MDITGTFTPFRELSPDELRKWIREKKEGSFVLLDVRQPGEYRSGHLPGALLLPLPELPERLAELDSGLPVVVYCRSGNRSRSAASLLAGTGVSVYNMTGGMLAWHGQAATGPAESGMELIRDRTSPEQLVALAWALEDGAGRFYRGAADSASDENAHRLFLSLVEAEDGHKRKVLDAWRALSGREPGEDELRRAPAGLMEGGYSVEKTLDELRSRGTREILEAAMQIETNSLDLYLKIMRWIGSSGVKEIFSRLVSEEKTHLNRLGRLLEEM